MDLTIINKEGRFVTESREVAVMVDKEHKHLLRDIDSYIDVLSGSPTLDYENFFIKDTFENRGKQYPCYLLTRKGCDLVANKMIGAKGVLFTAIYVSKFEEMEKQLYKQIPQNYRDALLEVVKQIDIINKLEIEAKINAPKLDYYDLVMDSNGLAKANDLGAKFGMSAMKLNATLKDLGIQYKQGATWYLYGKYKDQGFTESPETEYAPLMKWTKKGVKFVIDTLIEKGYKLNNEVA